MVLSHENRTKFEAAVEEVPGLPIKCTLARSHARAHTQTHTHTHHAQVQDLKTKFAVTEEICRTAKEQVERLQQELKDKAEQAQALDKEHAAVNMKVAEMQARMDCKEQQHAQIIATMSQSQDMHTTRLKEVEQEKEAVAEQLRAARAHADDLSAQVVHV